MESRFKFRAVGGASDACGLLALWGRAPASAHRNYRPMSPLPTGRHKPLAVASLRALARSSISLAERTMHRRCRGYDRTQVHLFPPTFDTNQFKATALNRSLLRKRCANNPSPWNVAPTSRKPASKRSPARSTKVRPPRSTSRAVPGDVRNLKFSAHEPTSRPISLTLIRWSCRIIESISTFFFTANSLPD